MTDHGTNGVSAINKDATLDFPYVVRVHGEVVGSGEYRNEAEEILTDYLRHHLRHQHGWKGDDLKYMRSLSLNKLRQVHEIEHIESVGK